MPEAAPDSGNARRSAGRRLCRALEGLLAFHVLWHVFSLILGLDILPLPHEVYLAFPRALEQGIGRHLGASLGRVAAGTAISLSLALLLGIPLGCKRSLSRVLSPLVYLCYPVPKLALLPLVMVLAGIGESAKITVLILILFFPLLLSVRDAVRAVPEEECAVLVSLNGRFRDKLRHIILPACLPAVLSSLRVSVGIAFSALFVTETFGTDTGLGLYVNDCWMRLDYIQMYFGIALLAFVGVGLFALIDLSERVFCRWRKPGD
ncbi:MAG: ABC transporter permease subunit [Deltaproteobacteria bacterium]|nr:ABC transporter permease subunit [Deltaproteobacteria bacterium]